MATNFGLGWKDLVEASLFILSLGDEENKFSSKHSSLLGPCVSYEENEELRLRPHVFPELSMQMSKTCWTKGLCDKTFYHRKL